MSYEQGETSSPRVGVVVVNYNGLAHLEGCLQALERQSYGNLTVYLVDNASTDASTDEAEQRHSGIVVIRSPENRGWSGGNNLGIQRARKDGADYIWLLNADIDLEPDCVEQLVEAAADSDAGILGPVIYDYSERERRVTFANKVDWVGCNVADIKSREEFNSAPPEEKTISGCAMFVRSSVFEEVGMIDERYFMYLEDVDFCIRAVRKGYGCAVAEKARLYHKMGGSLDNRNGLSPFKVYHGLRSTLLFWRKHLSRREFHRTFCAGHLGKWLSRVEERDAGEAERVRANAVMDALWYFLRGYDRSEWIYSPSWFRRFVSWKPWLIDRIMSL
ncbi:MAG: glycosyltransferase family 2 protein [Verrucomicrobia bacterium]|nr:glycosyltransferase family 2 protein [Verrucomicrobiota bacterium]